MSGIAPAGATRDEVLPVARLRPTADFLPELRLGFDNLRAHKLRSLLTMLDGIDPSYRD